MNVEVFEALMLICFGSAWPFAIAKSWRSRSAGGKSPIFLVIIFTGYISGIYAHVLRGFSPIVLLYILNATMVFTDLCLVLKFHHAELSKRFPLKHGKEYSPNDLWVVTLRLFRV